MKFRWWENGTNPEKMALHYSTLNSMAHASFRYFLPGLGFLFFSCTIATTLLVVL